MTTAQIFAEHLGLNESNAPWAYELGRSIQSDGRAVATTIFTATSPLAEKPTAGWLEVLVGHKKFFALDRSGWNEYAAAWDSGEADLPKVKRDTHPTRAVALALLAADPDLRARCEQASDAQLLSATNENQPHA